MSDGHIYELEVRFDAINRWVDHALKGDCTYKEAHKAISDLLLACVDYLKAA